MRTASEHRFVSHDGTELFFRAWLPTTPITRAVLLFHRGHEHSGRLQGLVDGLDLPEYAFFAWDQRGCGQSPGERGAARHFSDLVRDVEAFFQHVRAEWRLESEQIAVVAHSVAAVVVGLWAHDYAPRINSLTLATPALDVKLYVPLARPALRLAQALKPKLPPVQSYVTGKWLTHDPEQARGYDNDPLISKQIAVNILLGLSDAARRLEADAAALEIPTLVLCARADWVVRNNPIRRMFASLPQRRKEIKVYRDFFHAVFHEKGRERVFADVRRFLQESFEHPLRREHLLEADRYGHTNEEYQFISAGLPMLHPRRWAYRGVRLAMQTLGRLSKGIRLGWRTGFGSGQTLDYVYEDRSRGFSPLGKLFDRAYLNGLGWRCIRVRRQNLEALITHACAQCPAEKVRIVDLAGGPGRYLIELLPKLPKPAEALIRDMNPQALEAGRKLAAALPQVRHEQGDAFSKPSLAQIGPVEVAVVSGLFELFEGNQPVRTALEGLFNQVQPGGYLVYTNQPHHPQLELIAELLIDRGKPWAMRRRSQAEMDELVRAAGFVKEGQRIDDEGVFTVSIARRP